MLHCSTLLLHVLLGWCSVAVVADPFYCDSDIIPGIEPLTSYFYHCDGLNQVSSDFSCGFYIYQVSSYFSCGFYIHKRTAVVFIFG